jgi:hypothetical protein
MMMMTSVNPAIINNLKQSIRTYGNLNVLDSVVDSQKTDGWNTFENSSTNPDAYSYNTKKLNPAIKRQKEAYRVLMEGALADLAKTGTLNTSQLNRERTIEGTPNTDGNDDGAQTVKKTDGELLEYLGLGSLVNAPDISPDQKRQLAGAYLAELKKREIADDSAKPTFENEVATSTATANKALESYATLKEAYIKAVKKAKEDGLIQLTNADRSELSTLDAAKYSGEIAPTDKFDPSYGAVKPKGGLVSQETSTIVENLKGVKGKLDVIRQQFKTAGVDDIDKMLDSQTFKPSTEGIEKIQNLNGDKGTQGASSEAQKKFSSVFGTEKSNSKDPNWKPLAKAVKLALEEQTKAQGNGKPTTGISLENFDKILKNDDLMAVAEATYKAKGNTTAPTLDEIFNEKTGDAVDENGNKIGGGFQYKNEILGAEETNRTRSLAKENIGRPIGITTQRDQSPIDVGTTKVKGIDVQITFEPEETQVNKNSANSKKLLLSTFRGQPAVISQKGGKFYVRFYDTQKAGNGHVLTTGIAEVDPKLVFKNKEYTQPKTELDVSMLKKDSQGRKVIDYYVRSFAKGDFTDDNKVYYVARNFADNVDRLPSVTAAQYFAAMDADPINFKTKEQQKQAKVKKQETQNISLDAGEQPSPISPTDDFVSGSS